MKLFIWNNPFKESYGGSFVFAVAKTEDEARRIATTADVMAYGEYDEGPLSSRLEKPLGEPTRVLDLPCAEAYRWSE